MKKINKLGYIAIGIVLTLILGTATPVFAATKDVVKQLTAYFTSGGKPFSIYVNGIKLTKDGNGKAVTPFAVDGTTYLPVKAIADALGKEVTWEGATASIMIENIQVNVPGSNKDNNTKLTTTIDDKGERHDSLDYKFTLDKDAVGEWKTFYWYKDISDFTPALTPDQHMDWSGNSIYADGTMVMRQLEIRPDGSHNDKTGLHWTKGYFADPAMMSGIPAYAITTINGKTFMFVEWKSGDYLRNGDISYYVFVKTSNTPAPAPAVKTTDKTTSTAQNTNNAKITVTKDKEGVIHESMDYVFVPDKDAVGKWEQIDFVASPDEFDSKNVTKRDYIETGIHNFYDGGREIHYADKKNGTAECKWTKGYVAELSEGDTISSYEIKQLNGKTFMFIEWKTGDYTIRGQKPAYYVYVRTSDTPDPEFAK